MRIPVYILKTEVYHPSSHLRHIFEKSKLFRVINKDEYTSCYDGITDSESEAKQVVCALKNSYKNYRHNYCILIKDTSVTNSTTEEIEEIVLKAIGLNRGKRSSDFRGTDSRDSDSESGSKDSGSVDSGSLYPITSSYSDSDPSSKTTKEESGSHWPLCSDSNNSTNSNSSNSNNSGSESCELKRKWELCYLTKWLDRCDLYKVVAKMNGVPKIVKTYSPLGIQAILFSPKGRDIVLGKSKMKNGKYFTPIVYPLGEQLSQEIGLKNISAVCIIPNLFDFNVMLSQNDLDLLKLSQCRLPDSNINEETPGPGIAPFLWFLVTVAGVILLAWFFYQFIGKYDKTERSKEIRRIRKGGG